MKPIRLTFILVLIWVVVVFLLPGRVSKTYEFAHPVEEIVSIDLLINTNDVGQANADLLVRQRSLTQEETTSFMSEIYGLETRRCYPPLWGWGDYVARITYANGDAELLGSANIEFVPSGASSTGDGPYSFWHFGAFEAVFLQYMDS